ASPAPSACTTRVRTHLTTHPPTSAIYTLSLHDALPISLVHFFGVRLESHYKAFCWLPLTCTRPLRFQPIGKCPFSYKAPLVLDRSEEHTSELQSRFDLVCRLLLEHKKSAHAQTTLTISA